jgi:hypothetical protein
MEVRRDENRLMICYAFVLMIRCPGKRESSMRAISTAVVFIGMISCAESWAQAEKTPEEIARERDQLTKKDPRERSPQWARAIERIRAQPRPGEIQNAGITAYVGDIVAVSEQDKAEIKKVLEAYDAAVLERAAKWEDELKTIRAQYEDKVIALLPAERREAIRNALKLSHDHWGAQYDLEAALQQGSLERFKNMPPKEQKAARDKAREELRTWLEQQKTTAKQTTADVLKKIKELLLPDEAKRLEEFDRDRMVAPPKK